MSTGDVHRWYNRAAWRKRQAHQLRLKPLCEQCEREGRLTPATVVDHVEPHKGDYNKFRLGRLQSLCQSCHSSTKAIIEKRGYDPAIGVDGWPIDPRHPVYKGSA
jgi:5-methylcytosine-specific restriction protein A